MVPDWNSHVFVQNSSLRRFKEAGITLSRAVLVDVTVRAHYIAPGSEEIRRSAS